MNRASVLHSTKKIEEADRPLSRAAWQTGSQPVCVCAQDARSACHYVAKDTWEAELEAKVMNSAVKDQIITDTMKPIQLARVRMAWKSATKVMEVADSQASSTGGKEDEPLLRR